MKLTAFLLLGMLGICAASTRADDAGEAMLQKCIDAETRLQTLQADFSCDGSSIQAASGTLVLKKPNIALIVVNGSAGGSMVRRSDGKKLTIYARDDNVYEFVTPDITGSNVTNGVESLEAVVFFNPDMLNRLRGLGTGIKGVGRAVIGGVNCDILQVTGTGSDSYRIFIGPDHLLRGFSSVVSENGHRATKNTRLAHLKANPPLAPNAFAWTPPRGAKTVEQVAASQNSPQSGASPNSGLLPVGKKAPNFELPQPGGGPVSLSAVTKANRVTLLNFWATWCGPCCEELPHLNQLLAQYRSKGFTILSVNLNEDAKTVAQFWKKNNYAMQVAIHGDKIAAQYGVEAIPTNYVIGNDGKILARFVGFDEAGIRQALAAAGVK